MAVLIFKPTENCNSNCIYCEVKKKQHKEVMSLDLLELTFAKINEYLSESINEELALTWHGGEACLLGVDYFRKALEYQDKLCPTTKSRIKHLIQSNLTLISQDYIDVFKEFGIDNIGSSYDPLPHIRGFGKERDSNAYNTHFMKGINILEMNKITWGVIYVVHRQSLTMPLELLNYLTNLNLESAPNFHRVKILYEDKDHLAISAQEFADFLGAIFKVWWSNRDRFGAIQPFQWYVDNILDKKKSLNCEISGDCSYNWLYLGPEGEASHCGIAGDYQVLSYGNIKNRSIHEILHDRQRDEMAKRQIVLAETKCKDCRFWQICHGGCPVAAYVKHGNFNHPAPSCEETMIFLEKYFEPITGVKVDLKRAPREIRGYLS